MPCCSEDFHIFTSQEEDGEPTELNIVLTSFKHIALACKKGLQLFSRSTDSEA